MHREPSPFKAVLTGFGILLAAIALGFAVAFAGNAFGLFQLEFFGTKKANIERKIFEESQSYRHGMIRDLRNLRMDYEKAGAGSSERAVIRSTVLHRAGAVDRDELPLDVRTFINQLEQQ